jgi:hypothetical protein
MKAEQKLDQSNYWKQHILKADVFSGSDYQYCLEQGLKKSTFYAWRERLKPRLPKIKHPSNKQAFLPIEVTRELPRRILAGRKEELPDAGWLAELILSLINGGAR